ncbi:hypothetical protein HDU76_009771 [Blyttiomyces sp. JEL0837]|nr:hypothetical protein HDU76_009771 [Blyttiomyces sp. JEL0837]
MIAVKELLTNEAMMLPLPPSSSTPSTPSTVPLTSFKIMCWNILARLQRVLQLHNPDIAILQEVDMDQWNESLESFLSQLGYQSFYVKKRHERKSNHGPTLDSLSRRQPTLTVGEFEPIDKLEVHFDNHPLISPTLISPATENVGQILTLRIKNLSQSIWVMIEEVENVKRRVLKDFGMRGVHVFCGDFNTLPCDALYSCLSGTPITTETALADLSRFYIPKPNPTTPSQDLPISNTPQQPQQPPPDIDAMNLEVTITIPKILSRFSKLNSYSSIYSTYRDIDKTHQDVSNCGKWIGEPSYTNYSSFKGTLDYIFLECNGGGGANMMWNNPVGSVNEGVINEVDGVFIGGDRIGCKLVAKSLLKIPDFEELEPGLPHLKFPSDHLPVAAVLDLVPGV